MSPELAILNQLDADTRTDIYSLGVVLYELLTGQPPLNLRSLKPEMLEERLRRIREQEPARPSNRMKIWVGCSEGLNVLARLATTM